MSSTSFNDFLSIQTTWKTEIHEQFLKFKREESVRLFSVQILHNLPIKICRVTH